jgi:hypothetical protein
MSVSGNVHKIVFILLVALASVGNAHKIVFPVNPSACLSVGLNLEQFEIRWLNLNEIWYFGVLLKVVFTLQLCKQCCGPLTSTLQTLAEAYIVTTVCNIFLLLWCGDMSLWNWVASGPIIHRIDDTVQCCWQGMLDISERNLSKYHFVHHKVHMHWSTP